MSLSTQRQSVEARWATEYTGTAAVRYEQDGRPAPRTGSWVRLTVLDGARNRVDINLSAPRVRNLGTIFMEIFVPEREGTDGARALADVALPIFDGKQFGGISCRYGSPRDIGATGDGFWRMNIEWPFYRDET